MVEVMGAGGKGVPVAPTGTIKDKKIIEPAIFEPALI
jgi:hypothetical protein